MDGWRDREIVSRLRIRQRMHGWLDGGIVSQQGEEEG